MVRPAALSTDFFARVGTLARATCHVAPIDLRLTPSSFRRSGASNKPSSVPISPAVRAPDAKMLGQTLRHTDAQTNTIYSTFFSDPPEKLFDHNTFNAKGLKPLFSTILN